MYLIGYAVKLFSFIVRRPTVAEAVGCTHIICHTSNEVILGIDTTFSATFQAVLDVAKATEPPHHDIGFQLVPSYTFTTSLVVS